MMKRVYISATILLLGVMLQAQDAGTHLASLFADTAKVHCSRMGFNNAASDFGVTKYKSGYVFASSRNTNVGIQYYSEDTLTPLLDLYYFTKKDSAKFSKPKPFSKELNSKFNDGPATFSHDGNTIVFTRSMPSASDNAARMTLTLVISKYENGKWQKPEPVSFCLDGWNYSHPSFSPDDSVLYFTSDYAGGFGGLDIYYSRFTKAGWSKPVNAGKKINTAYNEEFPFCSGSGNLYFDSDRPGGFGMLDVYVWDMRDSAYTFPQILSGAINSAADDFAFWCSENESEGFFSSNRNNSMADDDIYFFNVDWPSAVVYDTIQAPVLCYEFFEEASAAKVDTVDMAYMWTFSDGTVMKGYSVFKCFDTLGTYTISLDIRDSSSGELFINNRMNFDLEIVSPNPITVFLPDTIPMNKPLRIEADAAATAGYKVNAVYYDFGYGYKSSGKSASHVYYKQGTYYPQIFFLVKDELTGVEECRCVVKKIIVE